MRSVLIILTVMLILVSCSSRQADIYEKDGVVYVDNHEFPEDRYQSLNEVMKYESSPEDSVYFQLIADIKEDNDGNVYILDKNASELYKFDASGKFSKKLCRQGMGPSEVNKPNNICLTVAGNIIISDSENEKFLEITRDGEYVKSVKSPFFQAGLIFPYGDNYLAATNLGLMFGELAENYLYVLSDDFEIIDRFGESVKSEDAMEMFYKNISAVSVRNRIAASAFYADNKIDVFIDNKLHTRITRQIAFEIEDVKMTKQMNNGRETTLFSFNYVSSAMDISPDGDLYVVTLAWGDSNKAEYKKGMPISFLEVFDSKGVIQAKLPLYYSVSCIYVNDKGYIYILDNEEQVITKYSPVKAVL